MIRTRSLKTAYNLLTTAGPAAVARASIEKAGMWWRHGSTFDVGRIIGRNGQTIQAIRALLSSAAARHNQRATIEIIE